jgi:DNA-binding transcriptional ArsR family regulator
MNDKPDLNALRMVSLYESRPPAPPAGPFKPRRGEYFLKGPIPWPWLIRAAAARGKALHIAIALWFRVGLTRKREVRLSLTRVQELGISRSAASRGLNALEDAGLVTVVRRPGRNPVVTLLETPRCHRETA